MLLKRKRFQKGFTLIEVVVAILIFVILTAAVLIFLMPSRDLAKSRDAKRVSELNSLKNALQLYYLDEGMYPEERNWCSIEPGGEPELPNCRDLVERIRPYFNNKMPGDPLFPNEEGEKIYSYQYKTIFSGDEYKIHADLEKDDFYEVCSGRGCMIEYYSPNLTGPDAERLPHVYTHEAEDPPASTPDTKVFVGELLGHGTSGKTIQVGFEWYEGAFMLGFVDIPCLPLEGCELEEFRHTQSGLPVGPYGSCLPLQYRAKAQDELLDWGYGDLREFYVCG